MFLSQARTFDFFCFQIYTLINFIDIKPDCLQYLWSPKKKPALVPFFVASLGGVQSPRSTSFDADDSFLHHASSVFFSQKTSSIMTLNYCTPSCALFGNYHRSSLIFLPMGVSSTFCAIKPPSGEYPWCLVCSFLETCCLSPSTFRLRCPLGGTLPSSNARILFVIRTRSLLLFILIYICNRVVCPSQYLEFPEHLRPQINVSPLAGKNPQDIRPRVSTSVVSGPNSMSIHFGPLQAPEIYHVSAQIKLISPLQNHYFCQD